MAIFTGRKTHHYEGELVVFLIGMRINKPWRIDKWLPVVRAMGPMLTELTRDPDSGLRGFRLGLGVDGPFLVQYWSSVEKLYAYANDTSRKHRPAWLEYYRRARNAKKAVGVWHETYTVNRAESMYVNMPRTGLAAATQHVSVTENMRHASDRLNDGTTTARPSTDRDDQTH